MPGKEDEKKVDETKVDENVFEKALTKLEDIVKACSGGGGGAAAEGETEEEQAAEEKKASKKPIKKSFEATAEEASDEIAKGLEVSEFLKDLVGEVGGSIDSLSKSIGSQSDIIKSVVATQGQIGEILKAFGAELKEQRTAIDALKVAPAAGRKSVISKGVERFEDEEAAKLNPTTIKKALEGLFEKGQASAADIVRYESSQYITPALLGKVTKEVMG